MTILITGVTGFLGSYLLHMFKEQGHTVIGLKRTTSDTYRIDDIVNDCILYDSDITTLEDIYQKHIFDIVINTVTDYGRKNSSITTIVETNLLFGLKLLELSVKHNINTFINTDTLLDRNINTYALSKAQLVDWMKYFSQTSTTKMINIKIEHMYGVLDDENKFIYWLINQLKNNVAKIDLTSGIQKRDFIYIDDIINAYIAIINNTEKLEKYEEFELGTGKSVEVKYFIESVFTELNEKKTLNTELNFGAIPYREGESMNMCANITKLEQLGWHSSVSIEDGIQKIINGESTDD